MSSMMEMQWSVPMWCVAQAARTKVILCCKVVVGETLPEWPIISLNFLGFQQQRRKANSNRFKQLFEKADCTKSYMRLEGTYFQVVSLANLWSSGKGGPCLDPLDVDLD